MFEIQVITHTLHQSFNRCTPVSYTHLDVYKRQAHENRWSVRIIVLVNHDKNQWSVGMSICNCDFGLMTTVFSFIPETPKPYIFSCKKFMGKSLFTFFRKAFVTLNSWSILLPFSSELEFEYAIATRFIERPKS